MLVTSLRTSHMCVIRMRWRVLRLRTIRDRKLVVLFHFVCYLWHDAVLKNNDLQELCFVHMNSAKRLNAGQSALFFCLPFAE